MSEVPVHPRVTYRNRPERTLDADTVDVLPLPPVRLRLLGFDAAELRGGTVEEKKAAIEQADWVRGWIAAHPEQVTDERGPDPFGRKLAYVRDAVTGECLNFEFVKRYPERAANPRFQAARMFGADPAEMGAYRP